MSRVLVIGGAHLDRRGHIDGDTVPGASNPGRWHEEAGGGAFNAAVTLARLGHAVRLIAPRGGDAAGDVVAAAAEAAGIEDTPLTFLDRATPSYTAILDSKGDLVVGLADMGLYDLYGPRQIARRGVRDAIGGVDAVLTDANLPAATLAALGRACAVTHRPLFAIAISPAKVGRLGDAFPDLTAVFMNEREATAIAERSPVDGRPVLVVTRGPRPTLLIEPSGAWQVSPPPAERIVDVTGAGDALAAGFIDGRLRGFEPQEALRRGLAAASLALASDRATPDIDRALLDAALASVPAAAQAGSTTAAFPFSRTMEPFA